MTKLTVTAETTEKLDSSDQSNSLHDALPGALTGSYSIGEVQFLLRLLTLESTPIAEKERLIQTGQQHYSRMITRESPPSDRQASAFQQALAQGGERMAREVQQLALQLVSHYQSQSLPAGRSPNPLVLVSLVRAGVPLGILLARAIRSLGMPCVHYGISILRDRGIDALALEAIVSRHGAQTLYFVDGWTGKGAISQELEHSLAADHRFPRECGRLRLVTLADPAGEAWLCASAEDWLIPTGLMGATVSGLLSRSVCLEDTPTDWHGCTSYPELAPQDQSQRVIEHLDQLRQALVSSGDPACLPAQWSETDRFHQQRWSRETINALAHHYQISNRNRIKPGLAEATRALLRRAPDRILLKTADAPETAALRALASELGTGVDVLGEALGPYQAVTLIASRSGTE